MEYTVEMALGGVIHTNTDDDRFSHSKLVTEKF
jgi:hypothetical protein